MTQEKPNEDLSEQLSSLFNDPEAIKKAAEATAETVAEYIRKHPYTSIGITLGAGFALGMILGKKNK